MQMMMIQAAATGKTPGMETWTQGTSAGNTEASGAFGTLLVQMVGAGNPSTQTAVATTALLHMMGMTESTKTDEALQQLIAQLDALLARLQDGDIDSAAAQGENALDTLNAWIQQATLDTAQPLASSATMTEAGHTASDTSRPNGSEAAHGRLLEMLQQLTQMLRQAPTESATVRGQAIVLGEQLKAAVMQMMNVSPQDQSTAKGDKPVNVWTATPKEGASDVPSAKSVLMHMDRSPSAANQVRNNGESANVMVRAEVNSNSGQGNVQLPMGIWKASSAWSMQHHVVQPAETPVPTNSAEPVMELPQHQPSTAATGEQASRATADAPAKHAETMTMQADRFAFEMSKHVLKSLRFSSGEGMSEARITLMPEQLGQVHVKLTLQNGQLVAKFVADTIVGRDALEAQLPQLRAALQNQGIQVEKLEVSHGESFAGHAEYGPGQRHHAFFGQSSRPHKGRPAGGYEDLPLERVDDANTTTASVSALMYGSSFEVTA